MSAKIVALTSLLALAKALPSFPQWSPPGPNDVRSPCPGLNTMANHGILSHDGKGLSIPDLQNAMKQTYNIGLDLSTVFAVGGLLSKFVNASLPFPPDLSLSFDLDDLDAHNFIEHDASLSRADFNQGGDDHTFQQAIFDNVTAFYANSNNTSIQTAATAKYSRVQNESQSDSAFFYGPTQFLLSYGESALYLSAMGDPTNGVVPVDYVKVFFEQERLPYQEGWRTPSTQINTLTVTSMILKLVQAAGEEIPEGLIISNSTLSRALLGLDAMGSSIPSAIQAFLSAFGLSSL